MTVLRFARPSVPWPLPLALLSALLLATTVGAQATPREIRIEVKDKSGRPIPDAIVTFFLTGDSARTDSAGIAKATVNADTAINISVRKLGFEQRNARFVIGRAPAFNVRVVIGEPGQLGAHGDGGRPPWPAGPIKSLRKGRISPR